MVKPVVGELKQKLLFTKAIEELQIVYTRSDWLPNNVDMNVIISK